MIRFSISYHINVFQPYWSPILGLRITMYTILMANALVSIFIVINPDSFCLQGGNILSRLIFILAMRKHIAIFLCTTLPQARHRLAVSTLLKIGLSIWAIWSRT